MDYTPQQLYRLLFKAALISILFILLVAWIGITKIYQIYVIESARNNAIRLAESFSAVTRPAAQGRFGGKNCCFYRCARWTQDMLTGIFNRREIMPCIENEAMRINRR